MSSRIGLWLSSSRSASPRVPTVEYARSERSSAKSSQAAWNSALSCARSSALRLRQAGSSLKNVNLTNVRSATRRRVVAAVWRPGRCCAAPRRPLHRRRVTWSVAAAAARPWRELARSGRALARRDERRNRRRSPPSRPIWTSRRETGSTTRSTTGPCRRFAASVCSRVPELGADRPRADDAPADIVPGLLASSAGSARYPGRGVRSGGGPRHSSRHRRGSAPLRRGPGAGGVISAGVGVAAEADDGAWRLRGDGLLIAFAAPPPGGDRALPIGIAGRGFDGDLTSDSTRTRRLRPLHGHRAHDPSSRLGLPVPSQMDGEPIRSEGEHRPRPRWRTWPSAWQ